jgi:hypothetical protein
MRRLTVGEWRGVLDGLYPTRRVNWFVVILCAAALAWFVVKAVTL